MSAPRKNVLTCWLCGLRQPSHVMIALGDNLCHARVCAEHSLHDVIMHAGTNGWRIEVALSLYEDVAHVAERKARRE